MACKCRKCVALLIKYDVIRVYLVSTENTGVGLLFSAPAWLSHVDWIESRGQIQNGCYSCQPEHRKGYGLVSVWQWLKNKQQEVWGESGKLSRTCYGYISTQNLKKNIRIFTSKIFILLNIFFSILFACHCYVNLYLIIFIDSY